MRATETAVEAETLRESLSQTRISLRDSESMLAQCRDDLERQRIEYAAEVSSLEARIAEQAVQRTVEEPTVQDRTDDLASKMTSVDERIRAFRQHLHELHQNELEVRRRKSLSSRLSRLWKHSGSS